MKTRLASSIDLFDAYKKYLQFQKRRSIRTVETYLNIAQRFYENLNGDVKKLKAEDVNDFLKDASSKLSPATQAQWVSALKFFLKWAHQFQEWPAALDQNLSRPKVPKKMIQVFDQEDLPFLLKTISQRPVHEQLLFELIYSCGLRIHEAQNFNKTQVDFSQSC